MDENELQDLEIGLLLETIFERHGYDFRNYSRASITRRILNFLSSERLNTISEMIPRVLHDEEFFDRLFLGLSVNVTEFFRDPSFYLAFRKEVIPLLRTYPFIKIWHAGCATGQEVYSTAIILKEEGLYHRSMIYATDFNDKVIKEAEEGIYPMDHIQEYTSNYIKAGGKASFSDYYHAKYDSTIMADSLKKNILFSKHNLSTDGVFGEMQLIFCRNVLIYFNRTLQDHVLSLFSESMCSKCFLCLGRKETVRFSSVSDDFSDYVAAEGIYQKNR